MLKVPTPTLRRPRLVDVARRAGVAYSTAAKVLSGSGKNTRVSAETEQRILEAARDLKYEPNQLGRALAGGKSRTIGVIISSMDAPVEVENLQPIEEAARAAGYVSFIACSNKRDQSTARFVENLLRRRVDGLIYFDTVHPYDETLTLLRQCGVPVVFFDWGPKGWPARILLDRQRAVQSMAAHLHELGHRRAVFLSDPYHQKHPTRQIEPLRHALGAYGITLDAGMSWCRAPGTAFEMTAFDLVEHRVAVDDIPELLIAHNDQTAIGAIWALRKAGLSVPDDVSVVGWDDLSIASVCQPPLTTVRQPRGHGPAQEAVRLLLEQIDDPAAALETIVYSCEAVFRNSTAPPRKHER